MPTATGLGFASLFVGALLAFKTLPPRTAALLVFFGGWLFAPVGVFPAGSAQAEHPYWILGSALPSDMVWQKAWAVPLAVLAGAMAFDRTWLPAWRPSWFDAPVVFWCSWPLLQWLWLPDAQPAPLLSSLHLLGTWGFSWLIGRIYCSGPDGQLALARALALAGAACLPFALLEGLAGLQTYPWFFELHPFRNDGVLRRVGWRPVAFFENGNQYGLWVSLCALVAVALAWQRGRSSRNWRAVGWAAASIALAAQSTGGILLVVLGGILLAMSSRLRPRGACRSRARARSRLICRECSS